MKIAYLVVKNIARGGGIEKYTLELGSRMAAKGHEVTVYSMQHYGSFEPQVNGMKIKPVFAFKKAAMQKLSASFSAACKVLGNGGYDIVHLHSVAAGAFGWLPRLRGCKTILQMHGIEWQRSGWGNKGSRLLQLLEKISLPQSVAHTAVSKNQCIYFQQQYNRHMEYIPTATEIKTIGQPVELGALALEPGRFILFASRLVDEKGAHFLIEAFRKVKTDMKLVIAGDAQGQESYKAKLRKLAGSDSRICFPGYVEGRLLEELFGHAYLYVQPSIIEGLSIALLEAMSYGSCCLVSDIPENLEAIGDCGYAFENKNTADLTGKLQWLLDSPLSVDAVKVKAVNRIRQNYTWDIVADQMEAFYEKTLNTKI